MKRTTTAIVGIAALTGAFTLSACSGSSPAVDTGRAGTVTPAESSAWRGDLVVGVGDQQSADLITLPSPEQIDARCYGSGDNLRVEISAPNDWHASLTHGSQTVTVENERLKYPAQEFTTPQSSLDYDVEWNRKFQSKDVFLSGVTWDVPQIGDVEIQINEETPPHWLVKSAEDFELAMHISCGAN